MLLVLTVAEIIDVAFLEQIWETLSSLSPTLVLLSVFVVLFLAGCGFIIPEDIPLTFCGIMLSIPSFRYAYGGIWGAVAVVALVVYSSILTGDLVAYYYGYKLGSRVHKIPVLRTALPPERIAKIQKWFDKYGNWAVFLGRMMAGVRMATFVSAGMGRMPLHKFVLFDSLAALVTVPFWVTLGYVVGAHFHDIVLWMSRIQAGTWVVITAAIGILLSILLYRRFALKRKAREDN